MSGTDMIDVTEIIGVVAMTSCIIIENVTTASGQGHKVIINIES